MRFIPPFAAILLASCGSDPNPNIQLIDQSSLRTALGASNVDAVGVTVDPDNDKRYVLDADSGLYELTENGAVLVAGLDRMVASDRPVLSAFTDIAALGSGTFAMTALNDGFKLDLRDNTFESYFCYVPGIVEEEYPEPVVQMTRSVTYDLDSRMIYAQPQTFERDLDGDILDSQIGQFTLDGGEGFGWLDISDEDFSAGGMVKTKEYEMMLGRDSKLHRYDMAIAELGEKIDLGEYGVEDIQGLARDRSNGHILIVDGATDELFELAIDLR